MAVDHQHLKLHVHPSPLAQPPHSSHRRHARQGWQPFIILSATFTSPASKNNRKRKKNKTQQALTRIPILLHPPGHTASRRDLIRLRLQARAAGARAPGVHAALQRVALPPKHVVGVLSVPGRVARREHERLRAVGRPLGFVVEGCGVPDDLCRVRGLDWVGDGGKGVGERVSGPRA